MSEDLGTANKKGVDPAAIVKGRLLERGSEKGLKILGRDRWGNFVIESLRNWEWDLFERKEVPAQAVATQEGLTFIRKRPGIFRKIERGLFAPEGVSGGSGSLVVHPKEYPEVMIKFIRFAVTQAVKGENTPIQYLGQAATGIDLLRFKQTVQKVLESKGMAAAKPLFATRDVLVEEYIPGKTLQAFLVAQQRNSSPSEFVGITGLVYDILNQTQNEVLEAIKVAREEAGQNRWYFLGTDLSPSLEWKKKPVHNGKLVLGSSLANWIVRGEPPRGIPLFATWLRAEQEEWLRARLVAVDPGGIFASLRSWELEQAQRHAIGKYEGEIPSEEISASVQEETEKLSGESLVVKREKTQKLLKP